MTHHRLVHCSLDDLVSLAARRHPGQGDADASVDGRRWFGSSRPPGGVAMTWADQLPGPRPLDVVWWLEVEPGATGVLAHLTAELTRSSWPVPPPVVLAVRAWTGRELASLAREAEANSRAA